MDFDLSFTRKGFFSPYSRQQFRNKEKGEEGEEEEAKEEGEEGEKAGVTGRERDEEQELFQLWLLSEHYEMERALGGELANTGLSMAHGVVSPPDGWSVVGPSITNTCVGHGVCTLSTVLVKLTRDPNNSRYMLRDQREFF